MTKKYRGRNEGSLSQRKNGHWRTQIYQYGKRISRDFKTKGEAQAWLHKMQDQLIQGFDYEGSKITIAEYLPGFLESCRVTLRARTVDNYQKTIQKHIIPLIGNMKLQELRLSRIENFYAELIQNGVGVRTVRVVHNILHKALDKAVRYGLILHNPSHGAALPRYHHSEMMVLDSNEVSSFLIAAQESSYLALYYLAVTTGMRQGELFGLKWSDLQWNSGSLHIQRQVQYIPRQGWQFLEPKTLAGRRTIKLGENTLHMLRLHREKQAQRKGVAGTHWQEHDLVFPNSVGNPRNPSNMRIDFNKTLEKAGLKKVRFHDLRHTAASLLLNNGISPIVVSRMLGHSKPSTTMDIYGHLYHEMQEEAARLMDRMVSPIPMELPNKSEQSAHKMQ